MCHCVCTCNILYTLRSVKSDGGRSRSKTLDVSLTYYNNVTGSISMHDHVVSVNFEVHNYTRHTHIQNDRDVQNDMKDGASGLKEDKSQKPHRQSRLVANRSTMAGVSDASYYMIMIAYESITLISYL